MSRDDPTRTKRNPSHVPEDSTDSFVDVGTVRFARGIDPAEENTGLYIVLDRGEPTGLSDYTWRVLVLEPDADLQDEESAGQLATHSDDWLRDWTEPVT